MTNIMTLLLARALCGHTPQDYSHAHLHEQKIIFMYYSSTFHSNKHICNALFLTEHNI